MMEVIIEAENKNRTLASWTKEHVDQLATMKTAWDNFHSLVDNQQFVISHQVIFSKVFQKSVGMETLFQFYTILLFNVCCVVAVMYHSHSYLRLGNFV